MKIKYKNGSTVRDLRTQLTPASFKALCHKAKKMSKDGVGWRQIEKALKLAPASGMTSWRLCNAHEKPTKKPACKIISGAEFFAHEECREAAMM